MESPGIMHVQMKLFIIVIELFLTDMPPGRVQRVYAHFGLLL